MPQLVKYHGLSDLGLLRENNEDALLCLPDLGLFVVADGLGGHQAGEVASKEAADYFKSHYLDLIARQGKPTDVQQFQHYILESFYATNKEIFLLSQNHHLLKGMGTTFSLLGFFQNHFLIIHVGDSRIYRYHAHAHGFERLTHDHLGLRSPSWKVGEKDSYSKGYLTKALGTTETLLPQLSSQEWHQGDLFLLCSDGLSDAVSDSEICYVLSHPSFHVEEKVRMLVHLAKSNGGHDNITVMLVEMQDN